ncbi:hypothetical protein KAJ89_02830 [Candidatus Parcubacteria bacterium]|nr:hypothetical protein [Candidatus Parcubacteria bacterium]
MIKFTLVKNYIKLDTRIMDSLKLPVITVHGRFQPPLHVNHYATYIKNAFKLADHVVVLIANPYCNEEKRSKARWRSQKINNPFTYEERVEIFQSFFNEMKIDTSRYSFKPFEITNEESWTNILNKNVPNLINTYSDWSWSKLNKFKKLGVRL